jgi:predicted metal-dependent phosphoesterase TrpH
MEKRGMDLHTHTNVSDGVLSPEELIAKAIGNGFKMLAITDHNCLLPDLQNIVV